MSTYGQLFFCKYFTGDELIFRMTVCQCIDLRRPVSENCFEHHMACTISRLSVIKIVWKVIVSCVHKEVLTIKTHQHLITSIFRSKHKLPSAFIGYIVDSTKNLFCDCQQRTHLKISTLTKDYLYCIHIQEYSFGYHLL